MRIDEKSGTPSRRTLLSTASISDSVDAGAFGTAGFRAAACMSGLVHWQLGSGKLAWDELVKWY